MKTRDISSRLSSMMRQEDEQARIQMCKIRYGGSRHGQCCDLARWVAQLNPTQRQACAAYVQDRLRLLERLLSIVVAAKCEWRLCPDQAEGTFGDRALSDGAVLTPARGSTNAVTTR
jgi:hypothetical protein